MLEPRHVLDEETAGLLCLGPAGDLRGRRLERVGHVRGVPVDPDPGHRSVDLSLARRRQHRASRPRQPPFATGRLEQLVQLVQPCRVRRGDVHVLHQELHRGELPLAGSSEVGGEPGVMNDVCIAARVDEHRTGHSERPPLRADDDRVDRRAGACNVGDRAVQQRREVRLTGHQPVGEELVCPGDVEEDRCFFERHRATTEPNRRDGIGPLPREPAAHPIETVRTLAVQTADRSDPRCGGVPAEEAVSLDEHRAGAGARGCDGRRQAGRPPADHHHVGFGDDVGVPFFHPDLLRHDRAQVYERAVSDSSLHRQKRLGTGPHRPLIALKSPP